MKIEAGKRYVRMDGKITGTIIGINWSFYDPNNGVEYDENGQAELRDAFYPKNKDPFDLKSEYTPDDERK